MKKEKNEWCFPTPTRLRISLSLTPPPGGVATTDKETEEDAEKWASSWTLCHLPRGGDWVASVKWMEREWRRSSRPLIRQKNVRRLLLPLNRKNFSPRCPIECLFPPKQNTSHPWKTRIRSEGLVHNWENSLPVCSFHQRLQHAAAAAACLIVKDALLSYSKWVTRSLRWHANRDNLCCVPFFPLSGGKEKGLPQIPCVPISLWEVQPSHYMLVVRDPGMWSSDSVINK